MKKTSVIKKIWNFVSLLLVTVIAVFAVFLVGSRLMGLQVYTVISGSMEPAYSVGDIIFVKKVDPSQVKVGDPITFVLNEDLVVATHRVVEVDASSSHFYTKGDANENADASPVHFKNLIGKPVFSLPYLGYVSDWVQNPPGSYIAIAFVAVMVIAVFLPDFSKNKKNNKDIDSDSLSQSVSSGGLNE
ncbi:MAG: signal peptidase I [Clostridiales bacterium]|nr:signal peptidase I [Clostridiales bacterium]